MSPVYLACTPISNIWLGSLFSYYDFISFSYIHILWIFRAGIAGILNFFHKYCKVSITLFSVCVAFSFKHFILLLCTLCYFTCFKSSFMLYAS